MRSAVRGLASIGALAALASAWGCGGSATVQADHVVRITVADFKIRAPKHVPAGDHEFIVVRADADLPLRADGVTADEDAFKKLIAGVLEPGTPGKTRHLRVHLRPGRYELICNMSGHYLGGMRAQIEVS
jgi:hypothetical protein